MNKNEFISRLSDEVFTQVGCDGTLNPHALGYNTGIAKAVSLAYDLDEPEKVVIPYKVGKYIDKCKEENLTFINMIDKGSYPSKMYFWLANNPENHEKLAKAWVLGHTVEEGEDEYYIIIAKDKDDWGYIYIDRLGSPNFTNYLEGIPTFTEKEIRKMNERFMAFAVKVGDV
ncbi:hypothetical protein PHIM1EF22_1460 [Enterococcus phage phiM1EF22]|nr:hypothetical protein PHIM1EF22_1460 [Enterococcus phage phiM1EF22]CAI9187667.1 Phage protein (ACLAME 82) [Enterococcus phage Sw5]